MATSIGPITNALFDKLQKEFQSKETREKIVEHFVNPFVEDLWDKYSGYFTLIIVIQLIMIFLLILIFINIRK